jgi:hypothetical protein
MAASLSILLDRLPNARFVATVEVADAVEGHLASGEIPGYWTPMFKGRVADASSRRSHWTARSSTSKTTNYRSRRPDSHSRSHRSASPRSKAANRSTPAPDAHATGGLSAPADYSVAEPQQFERFARLQVETDVVVCPPDSASGCPRRGVWVFPDVLLIRLQHSSRDTLRGSPAPVWGRDEFGTDEIWNSNAVISWLVTQSGTRLESRHRHRPSTAANTPHPLSINTCAGSRAGE